MALTMKSILSTLTSFSVDSSYIRTVARVGPLVALLVYGFTRTTPRPSLKDLLPL
jgi:hypothetical protein